jgi:hypothetical protein
VRKAIKYATCPFDTDKCISKPVLNARSSVLETQATSYLFKNRDVCSWKLKPSDAELYFTTNFNITIENYWKTECYIVYGSSLDKMNDIIDCSKSNMTSYSDIPSDNHVFIIAVGIDDQAYFEFSYKVE